MNERTGKMEKCGKNRDILLTAMYFSQMAGTLQTLGNLSEDYFRKHREDIIHWAEEFVNEQKQDKTGFFWEKIAGDYSESD